jgi:hypothetical protein
MAGASIINKVMKANVFALLVIAKFTGLFLWGVFGFSDQDYFGQYSLCLGLVNVFYVVAGMRGRIYVLQSIKSLADYKIFVSLMFAFGIMATVLVLFLNSESDLYVLVVLVAASKFVDMFLVSNASFIQNQYSREMSFGRLNRHGWLVLIAFFAFLPFGLTYAIAAEVAILVFTVVTQNRLIQRSEEKNTNRSVMKTVFFKGLEFTATAGLNAGITSFFIYYVANSFDRESVYLIAKIIAAQAIFVRIITGNNIYFMKEIDNKIERLQPMLLNISLAIWFIVCALLFIRPSGWDVQVMLIVIGIGFSLVNCPSTILRQHVLLQLGPRRIGMLHGVELAIMLFVCFAVTLSPEGALFLFGSLRLFRTLILSRHWFSNQFGSKILGVNNGED